MKRTYRVSYELKGTRIVDVTVDTNKLPQNFNVLSPQEQDEVLYERQEYSVLHLEDIDYGKAVSILPLRENLRVVQ
jgi:hypothetical protein